MKAIVIHDYGNPEGFEEQDIAIPIIKETQVLVDMYATTVSSADQLVLSGAFRHMLPVQFPHVLGVELAGVVKEIGEKVTHVKVGDSVMGLVRAGGSYADYVALEESALTIIPSTLSFVEAAALPAGALTAWQSLFQYAKLQPGQRILIHAGAGEWAISLFSWPNSTVPTLSLQRGSTITNLYGSSVPMRSLITPPPILLKP